MTDIDSEFEDEIETITAMYPDQVSIEQEPNVVRYTIQDATCNMIHAIQVEFSKSNKTSINIKVKNHESCDANHSAVYLQKLTSK